MNYKPNPLKDLVNNFNEYGIFPTDEQMEYAIKETGVKTLSVLDLELNLLSSASKDENHPYHHMTVPTKEFNIEVDENGFII